MLREHRRGILVAMGLTICATVSFYVVLVYMPTFANKQLHLPLDAAFIAQVIGVSCLTLMVPLFGSASDRIGRKPILVGAIGLYLPSAVSAIQLGPRIKIAFNSAN